MRCVPACALCVCACVCTRAVFVCVYVFFVQAVDDWIHDTTRTHHVKAGKLTWLCVAAMTPTEMTYEQFHASIFELVDTWVRVHTYIFTKASTMMTMTMVMMMVR